MSSEDDQLRARDSDGAQAGACQRADLHLHLNGAIPGSAILQILTDEGTPLPAGFDLERDLVRLTPCSSLASYLTPWKVLRLFPRRPKNLDRLCRAVFSSLAENNVRLVELRSTVLYLGPLQGCSPTEALQRLIEATRSAALHHEVRHGLILTVTRGDFAAMNLSTLLEAYKDLGEPSDIVGIDLAGDEEIPYPAELPTMFREAKDRFGLGITIHAGETGRVENVEAAASLFGADRIGHGTAATKDPALLDLLAKQDICVEVCPISNRLTAAARPDEAHPLREFRRHGVPFVICSDNPGIHQRGLADDHVAAMAEGLSMSEINQQFSIANHYSFMEDQS